MVAGLFKKQSAWNAFVGSSPTVSAISYKIQAPNSHIFKDQILIVASGQHNCFIRTVHEVIAKVKRGLTFYGRLYSAFLHAVSLSACVVYFNRGVLYSGHHTLFIIVGE
jgi:hypothetical protein